jgi:hypothetical protein
MRSVLLGLFLLERMKTIMTEFTNPGPQLPAPILEALQRPFSHLDVQLRAAAPREKDGQWFCQAVPHVPRWIYEQRLHQVAPGAWSSLCPSLVVADDHLTLAVQVKIGSILHSSYGEMRIPRLAIPDALGEIVVSVPDAYSVAFIDACQRFGVGRYLLQLARRWVPYDADRQVIKLAREEQRALVQKLYQDAGLPLDLPATEIRPIGCGETAGKPGGGNRDQEQPATRQPESLEDARARRRARDLAQVKEQCGPRTMHKLLAKYRLKQLEDITDTSLTEVMQWLNQRKAS